MEGIEIREKLLCVLRNEIHNFKRNTCNESWYTYYQLGDITISPETVFKEVKIKTKYFWQKEKTICLIDYKTWDVSFSNYIYRLTKEEYEELTKLREERLREQAIKDLDKLCK